MLQAAFILDGFEGSFSMVCLENERHQEPWNGDVLMVVSDVELVRIHTV